MGNANQILVNYIWTYLQQGYSLVAIKQQLISSGYPENEVNLAVDFVYSTYYYNKNPSNDPRKTYFENQPKNSHEAKSIHHFVPLILLIIGILIFGFSFAYILTNEENISPNNQIIERPSFEEEETIIPEEEISNIPSEFRNNDLDTTIETENNNNNNNNQVTQPLEESQNIPFNRETEIDITEPFNSNIQYTKRQVDLKVAYFGVNNPDEAMKFCDILDRPIERDFCYIDLAKYSENHKYCSAIVDQRYKDDCHFNLVLEGFKGAEMCLLIENEFKKDSCKRVANLASIELQEVPVTQEELQPEDYAVAANFY